MIKNNDEGKGAILYGMHFYPGVAQYQEEGKEPYRVFLNEDTLRSMDPTFQGRPVFVSHVDQVEPDINELRKEADGWVIESFFNAADGKHWVKFIVVSDKAENAVRNGMRLSNCYIPKTFGAGGTWNGLDYDREITGAEFEHLAIVPNPRYEESIIMTPEEFKKYNEDKVLELKKLSNNKGDQKMKFSFFKRTKVDNSSDLESMSVLLPKSKIEIELARLINDADEKEMKKDDEQMAHPSHMVELDGRKVSVKDMMGKYKDAMKKMKDYEEEMKKHDDDESEEEEEEEVASEEHKKELKDDDDDEMEGVDPAAKNKRKNKKKNKSKHHHDDDMMDDDSDMHHDLYDDEDDDEDEKAKKKALELAEHEEKEIEAAKKKNARIKASRLKNAEFNRPESVKISLSDDMLARGKSLYGSN